MMMKEDLDLMRRPRSDRPCGNLTLSLEPPASSLASQDVGTRSSPIIRAGTGAPLVGRNPHERRLPSFVIREKVLGHFRHKKISWSPPRRRRPYGCGSDPFLPRRSLPHRRALIRLSHPWTA